MAHLEAASTNLCSTASPPEIDFSTATVIAVFMGQCPTTGYSIEVEEIIDTGLTVVVKVEKVYPGKNCVAGEALTYPYHIVKTSKINKQVIFQTFERTVNCS
ncbi:MAG: protease complex subunit PrcB family protein [Candidatus Bathyarchaeia archaeon]